MKKRCLIAIGATLLLFVIIILLAFGLTRGAVKAGDEFLGLIGSGKIAAAYENASSTLKSQQSVGSFEQAVKNLGLNDFASVSWPAAKRKTIGRILKSPSRPAPEEKFRSRWSW